MTQRIQRILSLAGQDARQHAIKQDPQGIDVRCSQLRCLRAKHLLGRHVVDRSHEAIFLGNVFYRPLVVSQPEIGNPGDKRDWARLGQSSCIVSFLQHNISGLNVSVDDAIGMGMRQPLGQLSDNLHSNTRVEAIWQASHPVGQRRSNA